MRCNCRICLLALCANAVWRAAALGYRKRLSGLRVARHMQSGRIGHDAPRRGSIEPSSSALSRVLLSLEDSAEGNIASQRRVRQHGAIPSPSRHRCTLLPSGNGRQAHGFLWIISRRQKRHGRRRERAGGDGLVTYLRSPACIFETNCLPACILCSRHQREHGVMKSSCAGGDAGAAWTSMGDTGAPRTQYFMVAALESLRFCGAYRSRRERAGEPWAGSGGDMTKTDTRSPLYPIPTVTPHLLSLLTVAGRLLARLLAQEEGVPATTWRLFLAAASCLSAAGDDIAWRHLCAFAVLYRRCISLVFAARRCGTFSAAWDGRRKRMEGRRITLVEELHGEPLAARRRRHNRRWTWFWRGLPAALLPLLTCLSTPYLFHGEAPSCLRLGRRGVEQPLTVDGDGRWWHVSRSSGAGSGRLGRGRGSRHRWRYAECGDYDSSAVAVRAWHERAWRGKRCC